MHLVYKALDKNSVPSTLPLELLNSSNADVLDTKSSVQSSVAPILEHSSVVQTSIHNRNKPEVKY
jgi:hypothetical protein